MSTALEEDDSVLFVVACTALTRYPHEILRILSELIPVSKTNALPFTTSANLLRLLLSYVSAVATPIGDIATVAEELADFVPDDLNLELLDLWADVQDLLTWMMKEYKVVLDEPQGAIVQTAQDIVASLAFKARKLGFTPTGGEDLKDALLAFIKAKTLELSFYYSDISIFMPLFDLLRGYDKFESWYNGLVIPYLYYWQNYASLSEADDKTESFLGLMTYWDQFDVLVAPLQQQDTFFADKLTPERYLTNVILPFAVYHDNNLQSLTTWMFFKHPPRKPSEEFQLWDKCINTVLDYVDFRGDKFTEATYQDLLRHYIAACIYFGIYREEEITSLEQSNIYDQIFTTIKSIISKLDIEGVEPVELAAGTDFDKLPTFDLFFDFLSSNSNPFAYLFNSSLPQTLVTLQQCISTCRELYPVNQLTIKEYLKLKSSSTVDYSARQKAVVEILSRLTEHNYLKLLNSIHLFSKAFSTNEINEQREIDQCIVERLLHVNLIPFVIEYYHSKQGDLKISAKTVFDLTLRKFWDLFENATSLDERIGKLRLANQCIEVMNTISADDGLNEEQKYDVVRIKHLLNALLKLRNFRFVIERNQPVTPHQVVTKLKSQNLDSAYSPIALISSVLEQNPKAYYAYEKLYKIASDLAIYLGLEITEDYLPKVQSACIESSLVEGNFDFAYKQSKDLFEYYIGKGHGEKLNEFWLTFYQVGKFILADWLNEYDEKVEKSKISTLLKQREILSLTLKLAKPSNSTVDNSRLILSQLRHINQEIKLWYIDDENRRGENVQRAAKSTHVQLQENINGMLNEAAHAAAQSKNQASQKLSNLLVSGLGWAIGAQKSDLQLQ